jgi:Chitobiase/beta-hexosaminidase C-terminal domain
VEGPAGTFERVNPEAVPARALSRPGRSRIRVLLISLFAILFVLCLWSTVLAGAAQAELARPGPVDADTGFPAWFEDTEGLRLEPCFAGPHCSTPAPDVGRRPATPGNIGGRVVYWSAAAKLQRNNGVDASLVLSTQGTFPSGEPADGTQHAFNRVMIAADNLEPGATYRVIHPYGTETFTDVKGGSRGIDFTEDVGCLQAPCDGFATTLNGRVGPWLTWNTLGTPTGGPPAGYIGDASTPHNVVGSPMTDASGNQQNYFEIRGPDVGGPGIDRARTALFTVEGKIARLTAFASPKGGLYTDARSVTLAASDPKAEIFYTTDGAEPTPDGTRYEGPISITDRTTLKFMAVVPGEDGQRSPVFTEAYTVGG